MPRDLFGDVTRPSISIGNRKWYTVPVSLLTHTLAIAAVVVLPLVAAPYLPGVMTPMSTLVITELVPPTPPPAPRKLETVKPAVDHNAAPIEAPSAITPEPERIETVDREIVGVIGGSVDGDPSLLAPPPAPVAVEPPKPVRIGGAVRAPVQTHRVDPLYPPIARSAGIQGIVIIEATIAEDGRVVSAKVLRSLPMLDQAALEAVRQWQYTPSTLNGQPVPVIMTVTVHFTLR